ncbi:FxSxx-COOH system tetratricopeptide repeat protein [Actinomadura sp. ATCC 31491]|uniref:FxSxx-COOH system tetratricopeptide repeat protein n=1 Tax=Actinomadura luzonensis TaxID=2805427 RepID=A0ABT0G271_9ACTN|nr:FxSxx-COOH system tetratricopeptide repeat protein [Actinomadura luzonensis]MCK2218702.1 FxSxx-COOH system tetratricopeptide repeat protein [Actinomadura luzonensis]
MGEFRPEGSTSRVLAELARLWDQARAHSPGQVTQKRLAAVSDVPYSTVNGWATGAAEPRNLDQLVQIGQTLAGWADEPALSPREWDHLMTADRTRPTPRPLPAPPPAHVPAPTTPTDIGPSGRADTTNRDRDGDRDQVQARDRIRVGVIPQPADCFQDRQVAEHVRTATDPAGAVVPTQVLTGTGGVGKTQLAASYARRAWQQGTEVLVWADAATRDGIVSAYADAATRLSLPAGREDPERAAQEFLLWAEITDRPWLVVLDDVRRPKDLNGLWPPAVASAAGGRVLVTTRLREAALAGADRRTVAIGTFTEAEARTYLRAKLGDRDPVAELDGLAADLGLLPLALAQAAAYIGNADVTCAAYRRRLAGRLLAHAVPGEDYLPDGHRRIVTATWELSVGHADRVAPAGLARPVLYLAGVLDPAGIPQAALTSPPALEYLTSYLPGAPAGAAAEDGHAVDADTVDEVLRVLHRHNLLDHDRTAMHREVRVHQLIQRATRENLIALPELGPHLFAEVAHSAADALLLIWPPIERDQLGPVLRANATALLTTCGTALCEPDTGAHHLLFHAVNSLGEAGRPAVAGAFSADLLAICLRRLGPDHPDTLSARYNVARWRGRAGDATGAVAAFEELLPDCERALGADHPHTLIVRGGLAYCRGEIGDAAGAAAEFKELVTDFARVLGPESPLTLTARANRAAWLGQAGDAAGAVTVCEELLAVQERVLGPEHPDTLITRHGLARWRGEADAAGATATLENLLTVQKRVLGPEHPHTLITRANLATYRGRAGDVAGAIAALEELQAPCLRVLGPDHPDTLTLRSQLAKWLAEAGELARSGALLKDLHADVLRLLGADHAHTLGTRHNLAGWQGEAGDAAGAAAAFEDLLADCERLLGPDHPLTVATRGNLTRYRQKATGQK